MIPRLLACSLLCVCLAGKPPKAVVQPVSYSVGPEIEAGAITALKIEVRFQADASGTTDFGWSGSWAGEQRLWQWARDVSFVGATAVEKNGAGHWLVHSGSRANVVARYRIISAYDHDPSIQESEQARPVIRPGWFYAVGSALFAMPKGRGKTPATFDWQTTPGIGFASDLEHLAGRYRAASRPGTVDDAMESIVIGGGGLRVFPALHGSGVRVATIGQYAFTPEAINQLVRRIISVERAFWKEDRSGPFLVTAAPIVGSGTATGYSGTGRGDAFALWIDQRTPLGRLKWLLAHEYFHTWNPDQLGGAQDKIGDQAKQFWFSEGFTDYYARALMVRAGVISTKEFAEQWNDMFAAYAASPVRNLPARKAAAKFFENADAQKLPYQQGALLAAIWNRRLVERSHGSATLDTVLRSQLALSRSSQRSSVELFRLLMLRHGIDTTLEERRFLERGDTITLPSGTFGPCATVETLARRAFSPGFNIAATAANGNVVTGLDARHPAFAAGLRDGMKILGRKGGVSKDARIPYTLLVEDHGRQTTIRYLPQGRENVIVQQLAIRANPQPSCAASLSGAENQKLVR